MPYGLSMSHAYSVAHREGPVPCGRALAPLQFRAMGFAAGMLWSAAGCAAGSAGATSAIISVDGGGAPGSTTPMDAGAVTDAGASLFTDAATIRDAVSPRDAVVVMDAGGAGSLRDAAFDAPSDSAYGDAAPSACLTSRPYQLALWHEGVVGKAADPTTFRSYAEKMAAFVRAKCFDKVFLELMDPTQFAWSSVSNIVYFLSLLPANVDVGALLYVNPKDSNWGVNPSLPGGLQCNNPGYTTAPPAGGCGTGPTFPPGCPNDLEQAFSFLAQINAAAATQGLVQRIHAAAFDGEDFGAYGASSAGLCQALQAAATFTPGIASVKDIGYAKGPSTNAPDGKTNAAYPELYWIGELDSCACPQECKFTPCPSTCTSCTSCYSSCRDTIYQQYKNDPAGLLNAMDKYYSKYVSLWQTPGTWPMFSNEMLDGDCVQKDFGGASCGTFNGFGNWDWNSFESFMTQFSMRYGISQIAVYEWQFVPPSWQ